MRSSVGADHLAEVTEVDESHSSADFCHLPVGAGINDVVVAGEPKIAHQTGSLGELGVKRIVTCDPHALNSLRNEYPEFGAHFEVVHHTQLIAELIAEGRMRPPGLREIERAKADGRWASAYASQSKATVPADLEQALG